MLRVTTLFAYCSLYPGRLYAVSVCHKLVRTHTALRCDCGSVDHVSNENAGAQPIQVIRPVPQDWKAIELGYTGRHVTVTEKTSFLATETLCAEPDGHGSIFH